MARKSSDLGPRLETLLDRRDHLRIEIKQAQNNPDTLPEKLALLRRRLLELDRDILKQWEAPKA